MRHDWRTARTAVSIAVLLLYSLDGIYCGGERQYYDSNNSCFWGELPYTDNIVFRPSGPPRPFRPCVYDRARNQRGDGVLLCVIYFILTAVSLPHHHPSTTTVVLLILLTAELYLQPQVLLCVPLTARGVCGLVEWRLLTIWVGEVQCHRLATRQLRASDDYRTWTIHY